MKNLFIGNSNPFYQAEVIGAIILDFFYEQLDQLHKYAYVPIFILYHIPTKKASLFLAITHFFFFSVIHLLANSGSKPGIVFCV